MCAELKHLEGTTATARGVRDGTGSAAAGGCVGFDSGPSLFSTRIQTHGIDGDTVRAIDEVVARAGAGGRGVVLFSHAPTRAALRSDPRQRRVGTMREGAEAIERLMMRAARRGQPVVHLSGHTHWSDLFVAEDSPPTVQARAVARLPCESNIAAAAMLVNAPSATRLSFHTVEHGRAYGFVVLKLSPQGRLVQFVPFDEAGHPGTPLCVRRAQVIVVFVLQVLARRIGAPVSSPLCRVRAHGCACPRGARSHGSEAQGTATRSVNGSLLMSSRWQSRQASFAQTR